MTLLLFLLASLVANAQTATPSQPSSSKSLPESGLTWEEMANPTRYLDAIGRRAGIFGKQNGQFEAWLWPIKVLHGFRLEFRLDNMPDPVRAENFLQSITVRPESTTLLYVHPSFTVKQIIWAADDRPAIVQWFDVESDQPLEITAKFVPDFKPMWPASMGGQHSDWLADEKAFALSDATYQPTALIGSPATTANTDFIDHSLAGGEMLLRFNTTPAISQQQLYPLLMILSMSGPDEARAAYRAVLANLHSMYQHKVEHWRSFLAATRHLATSDSDLNRAFTWAKVSIEQGWVCGAPPSIQQPGLPSPSVPKEGFAFPADADCGIVAGYGPSFDGERPGFAWWFGGDGLMSTWAMLDYGDADGALRELRFLKAHQRTDGKMMHEMVQSAGIVDWWGKYHFAYMHADTTPMYLYTLADYWQHVHDPKFLDEFWPSAKLAYQYCVSTLDAHDGLIDNTKSGLGAIEVGVLKGKVNKDIYVEGFWMGGLRAMLQLADATHDSNLANDAKARLALASASLQKNWWDPRGKYFAFGLNTAGERAQMLGNWSAILLSVGGGSGDPRIDAQAVKIFARPELATDWGVRWISNRSPLYDPLSYNNGTAWPFAGGLVAWAQYANGQPLAGYQTLMSIAHLTGSQVPGGMPEHMSGNRNQPGARSVPRQLFSSWSLITPVLRGMLQASALPGPVQVVPIKPAPEPGAGNTSMKILDAFSDDRAKTLTLLLAGLSEHTYELELVTGLPQLQVEGATEHKISPGFKLDVTFPGGEGFTEKTVIVKY
jgi:glycogen debranching enzyme